MKRSTFQILLTTILSLLLVLSCAVVTIYADSSNVNVDVDWNHVTFNNDQGRMNTVNGEFWYSNNGGLDYTSFDLLP